MAPTPAPIVLFAYARPEHTLRTLESLAKNSLAGESDLVIYSDGARCRVDSGRVQAVREIARRATGFHSIILVERESNYGLARNIIEGVTEVCGKYGRVIVLEDDIETSPDFLTFMNVALDRYADAPSVWHVSGWNYPIDPVGLGDAFLWRVMNCWGWATWADRWSHFQRNPDFLIRTWDKKKIARFNLDGAYDFWGQVQGNSKGKLNTWAIFWYATIFEHHGLCLNPALSFVRNIGLDGSGENCGRSEDFSAFHLAPEFEEFPTVLEESVLAVQRVKEFYKDMRWPLIKRVVSQVRRLTFAMGMR